MGVQLILSDKNYPLPEASLQDNLFFYKEKEPNYRRKKVPLFSREGFRVSSLDQFPMLGYLSDLLIVQC